MVHILYRQSRAPEFHSTHFCFQSYGFVTYMTSDRMNPDLDLTKQEKAEQLLARSIAWDSPHRASQLLSTKRLTFAHISNLHCKRHPISGLLGFIGGGRPKLAA